MLYRTEYDSILGKYTLVSDGQHIMGVWLAGQKYFLNSCIEQKIYFKDNLSVFNKTKRWLDCYFKGQKPPVLEVPLSPQGSFFQQKVWQILLCIPYGKTITYGEIAKKISVQLNMEKMSPQAVGGAVGHNPISIIIPCHRVVGKNDFLTGYAGGLNVKSQLLKLEGVVLKY